MVTDSVRSMIIQDMHAYSEALSHHWPGASSKYIHLIQQVSYSPGFSLVLTGKYRDDT